VVAKLNTVFNETSQKLAEESRLATLGVEPVAETPEEFGRFVRVQVARGTELLQNAGFKPE